MRPGRVVCACAVAASSLALLAPGASAFRHRSPSGLCRININVVPRHITTGEPVTIFGRLLCRGGASAAGGRVVKLFRHVPGSPGSTYVQSTTTGALGFYQFQRADGVVETNRAWFVSSHGAESAMKGVRVAAQATLSGPPEGTQLLTGPANKVTFTGTVNPADVGARVVLQRQNALSGNEWHRIDRGHVEAGGGYSITHTFVVPGDANIRVLVRSQRRNIPSPSNVLEYEISQAQNPELTIEASADPITYGQSVTIGGTLAGGAARPVTLLARTVRQPGFAPVATGHDQRRRQLHLPGAVAGQRAPSTRSRAHGKTSAVLYRGRQGRAHRPGFRQYGAGRTDADVLGQRGARAMPVTSIYLERQNASGRGFHVVQVGHDQRGLDVLDRPPGV